jgi:hypothetical protein
MRREGAAALRQAAPGDGLDIGNLASLASFMTEIAACIGEFHREFARSIGTGKVYDCCRYLWYHIDAPFERGGRSPWSRWRWQPSRPTATRVAKEHQLPPTGPPTRAADAGRTRILDPIVHLSEQGATTSCSERARSGAYPDTLRGSLLICGCSWTISDVDDRRNERGKCGDRYLEGQSCSKKYIS